MVWVKRTSVLVEIKENAMCVNESELLYLFSTITQALAAMIGIGIIAVAYINERRKSVETKLWNLGRTSYKKLKMHSSELSDAGITTTEDLIKFLENKREDVQQKDRVGGRKVTSAAPQRAGSVAR